MVEPSDLRTPIGPGAQGLAVRLEEGMQAATLRYFEPGGAFAAAVREATGAGLPQPLAAVQSPDGELTLAWRSPTETLVLTPSAPRLAQLEARLASVPDGCLVNLSGGLKVLRVTGERPAELLCRLGGTASVPRPGEAPRSRLADVPVVALSVRPGETLLLVDRAYAEHLMGWIRETLLDFEDA
jgi:heterotetrameric sarcosine oxidase gamma subunit